MAEKQRIMVVEDDLDARETLEAALVQSGYAVEIVADGSEALSRLAAWPADLVVSDVFMPEMSGTEMIDRLRTMGRNQPVVLITGSDGNIGAWGRPNGAAAVLRKPFRLDELVWAIECALACGPVPGRRPPPRSGVARAANRHF